MSPFDQQTLEQLKLSLEARSGQVPAAALRRLRAPPPFPLD
jgi:hypothetical protein